MTLEEAIGILEKDIHTDPPKSAITARKHDKAILMALKALEKQISKAMNMYASARFVMAERIHQMKWRFKVFNIVLGAARN